MCGQWRRSWRGGGKRKRRISANHTTRRSECTNEGNEMICNRGGEITIDEWYVTPLKHKSVMRRMGGDGIAHKWKSMCLQECQ